MIHLSYWEDRSSTPPMRSSTSDLDKSTSNSLEKRYVVISIVTPLMSSPRRPTLGGDVDHPSTGKNQSPKNGWKEDEEPEEVVKDQPTPPKTSPQTNEVWKEKVTSLESPSQKVQPSRSPLPR